MKKKEKKKHSFHLATWKLLLIFIPLAFLALTFLRLDHIEMTRLRASVLEADSFGDNDRISASLTDLKNFTSGHIIVNIVEKNGNTDLLFGTGPFYLEQSYQRSAEKAILEAEKKLNNGEVTSNIYLAASDTCKPQAIAGGWAWNSPEYINCMTTELQKTPAASDIVDTLTADVPSTELFRYEYSSPLWAPSIAGFIILICLIMLVVIFTRFIIWIIIRLSLLFVK